jgi:hypothetical protein
MNCWFFFLVITILGESIGFVSLAICLPMAISLSFPMYIDHLLLRKGFGYCSSCVPFYTFLLLIFQNCGKSKILFEILDQNVCFSCHTLIMAIR